MTLRICGWPGCLRAVRSSATLCHRHRPRAYCAVPGCRRRTDGPDHSQCFAHRKGGQPRGRQPKRHRSQSASCTVADCELAPIARGLCWKHYQRRRRRGTTELAERISHRCAFDSEPGVRIGPDGIRLCRSHWDRWRRRGDPLAEPRHLVNKGRVCSNDDGRPCFRRGLCGPCFWRVYYAERQARGWVRPCRSAI